MFIGISLAKHSPGLHWKLHPYVQERLFGSIPAVCVPLAVLFTVSGFALKKKKTQKNRTKQALVLGRNWQNAVKPGEAGAAGGTEELPRAVFSRLAPQQREPVWCRGLEQELQRAEDSTRHWAVLCFNAVICCRDEDAAA